MNSPIPIPGQRRICFLTAAYPSSADPARGCFIELLALNIIKNGYSVQVLAPRIYTLDKKREMRKGIFVRRFPFFSEDRLLIEHEKIPIFKMVCYVASGFFSLLLLVWKHKVGLIHAHWVLPTGLIAVLVKKITGVPVLLSARGADINLYPHKSRLLFKLACFSLRHSTEITAVSRELRNCIIRDFGISEDRLTIVSSGVDRSSFTPIDQRTIRKQLKLPKELKIVLFVGDLIPRKGLNYLIESIPTVLKKQGNVLFLIIGKGFLEKQLITMVESMDLQRHVHFLGTIPHEEVPLWINAADLLALPSISEGTPNVIMEALSCGVPVVASRVGGVPELVEDNKNGFLVEPRNSHSLAEALIRLLTDDQLLLKLRQQCMNVPPEREVGQMAKKFCVIYDRMLS